MNLENAADIKDIKNAEIDEQAINDYRDECREEELKDIESKGDAYFETVFYLNTLDQLEKWETSDQHLSGFDLMQI